MLYACPCCFFLCACSCACAQHDDDFDVYPCFSFTHYAYKGGEQPAGWTRDFAQVLSPVPPLPSHPRLGGGDGSMLLLGEELIVFVRRQAGWDLAHDDECHVHGTTRSGSGQSYDYGCGWMDGWVDVDGWVGRCRNGWCKF